MIFEPMLLTSRVTPFTDAAFTFEWKADGFRAILSRSPRSLSIRGRRGGDLLRRFPTLKILTELIPVGSVLDGEIIAGDGSVASFLSLMGRSRAMPISFVAFDLLQLRGRELLLQPIERRQAALRKLVPAHPAIVVTPSFDDGLALFAQAERLGLEGMVGKLRGSIYEPGIRSPNWIKVKTDVGRRGQRERSEIFTRS